MIGIVIVILLMILANTTQNDSEGISGGTTGTPAKSPPKKYLKVLSLIKTGMPSVIHNENPLSALHKAKVVMNVGIKNFVLAIKKNFNTYHSNVTWEEKQDIIKRSLTLLPLMMLARVDGKSPVEYIKNNNEKNKLRRIALDLIKIQNYDFNTFVNNL